MPSEPRYILRSIYDGQNLELERNKNGALVKTAVPTEWSKLQKLKIEGNLIRFDDHPQRCLCFPETEETPGHHIVTALWTYSSISSMKWHIDSIDGSALPASVGGSTTVKLTSTVASNQFTLINLGDGSVKAVLNGSNQKGYSAEQKLWKIKCVTHELTAKEVIAIAVIAPAAAAAAVVSVLALPAVGVLAAETAFLLDGIFGIKCVYSWWALSH